MLTELTKSLLQTLRSMGPDAAYKLLAATIPAAAIAVVHLVEADVSAEEALSYAAVLMELGSGLEGSEIVDAVVGACTRSFPEFDLATMAPGNQAVA